MKKGFTLAELLGVIIILGAVLLIMISSTSKIIKDGLEKSYNQQIDNIKLAMELWTKEYQTPSINEKIILTLSQLKFSGLIDIDIKNPKTKELFPNDMKLTINNVNGNIEYLVEENGTNREKYELIPSIEIIGDVLTYVEVGSSFYNEAGVIAKDKDGNIINDVAINTEPNLDLTKKGIYITEYRVSSNNYNNVAYRTIVVRDTIGPEITFSNNLEMTYEQSRTYDFKSDITVTDNSNEEVSVTVENNIKPLAGNYSIKYIAKDSSGNETIKLRKVTIKE